MALLKILAIVLAVSFIATIVKSLLAKRNDPKQLDGKADNPDFISEELYKLHELKNRGILSHEEYEKQKKKLLDK